MGFIEPKIWLNHLSVWMIIATWFSQKSIDCEGEKKGV
jgi:hypothetical protein